VAPLVADLHDGLRDRHHGRSRLLLDRQEDEPGTTPSRPGTSVVAGAAGHLMPVTGKSLGWLLAEAVSDLPESREEAAASAVDWETSMSDHQKRLVVRLLSLLASVERPGSVRETQLNAITNLFLPPFMTEADVAPLFEIPEDSLDVWDADYLEGLREAIAEFWPEPD
jgi:hypothetical protein